MPTARVHWPRVLPLLFSLCGLLVCTAEDNNATSMASRKRAGKVSLTAWHFEFKHYTCTSTSPQLSGGFHLGTCLLSSSCSQKSGTAFGACASGYGICCVFLVQSAGTTSAQNFTYLRNPSFPNADPTIYSIDYRIDRCGDSICQLRLDFQTFSLLGPVNSLEVGPSCSRDALTITGPNIPSTTIPVICGFNSGQHIYVDIGSVKGDFVTIMFTASCPCTTRFWEICVMQIPCTQKVPDGCLQYLTGTSGRITTFNFGQGPDPSSALQLSSQAYNVCMRTEVGMCCIEYSPCGDQPSAFSLDPNNPTFGNTKGYTDALCTTDYNVIVGGGADCCGGNKVSRYCGKFLVGANHGLANMPICDCSTPFMLAIITDTNPDAALGNTVLSRGLCLDYMQLPCN